MLEYILYTGNMGGSIMSYNLTICSGILLTVLSVGAGSLFLYERKSQNHRRSFWLKGAGSLFFVLVGLIMTLYTGTDTGMIITGGLVAGLIGDQLLALRTIYTEHKKIFFFTGGMAFSVGHIFYITALWNMNGSFTKFTAICFLIMMTGAIGYAEKKGSLSPGRLLPATIYLGFVAAVSAMALSSVWYHPGIGNLLFAIGGFSFFLSDNILGAYSFGTDKSAKLNILLHVTYYAAQLLIAWSILFL